VGTGETETNGVATMHRKARPLLRALYWRPFERTS
jgi:hypothetical protein